MTRNRSTRQASFRDILARPTTQRGPAAFGKLGGSRRSVVENADGVLHIFSGKQLAGGEIAAQPASQATPMPRSVVRSLSSRRALPKRCDILSERPIGLVLFPPRQRQQNGDQNIGEHRWDRDVVWPRRVNRFKQRAGVSAITFEVVGNRIGFGGVVAADFAKPRIIPN
jgi:hypothetical protein